MEIAEETLENFGKNENIVYTPALPPSRHDQFTFSVTLGSLTYVIKDVSMFINVIQIICNFVHPKPHIHQKTKFY